MPCPYRTTLALLACLPSYWENRSNAPFGKRNRTLSKRSHRASSRPCPDACCFVWCRPGVMWRCRLRGIWRCTLGVMHRIGDAGEEALQKGGNRQRTCTFRAVGGCTLWRLDVREVEPLLKVFPDMAASLSTTAAGRTCAAPHYPGPTPRPHTCICRCFVSMDSSNFRSCRIASLE